MYTPRAVILVVFGLFTLVFCLGSRPACDNRTPSIACSTISITVQPGQCVAFNNPCDPGAWDRVDGFRLCDPPAGIFVQTQRRRAGTTRELCASLTVGVLVDEPVGFTYVRPGALR